MRRSLPWRVILLTMDYHRGNTTRMRLLDYLDDVKQTPAEFARLINVSDVAVHRYLHKGRVPEPGVMARIMAATSGRVTPNDFYGARREPAATPAAGPQTTEAPEA